MNEKTDESWADFWKNRVFMQYECPAANCSTPQDQQRWMLDSRDAVWYEGWPGWQRHYVLGLSVRSSFCPSERLSVVKLVNLTIHFSILSSLTKLMNTIFWKQMSWFWSKLSQMVHWATARNGRLFGSGSHGAKIGCRNQFQPDISRTVWRILTNR